MSRVCLIRAWNLVIPAFMLVLINAQVTWAQPGFRESLIRLDKNKDGQISPDEITPLARPYLERITRSRRMSLDRTNSIDSIQDAARIYFALANGVSGRDVRPRGEDKVKQFGAKRDEPIVPGFGLADVKFKYIQDDVNEAYSTMGRYDRNRDGYIDREEARRNRWTHRDPFLDDLNKDGRLSHMELVQRYARRRLLEESSDQVWQLARRTGNGVRPGAERRGDDGERRDWGRSRSRSRSGSTQQGSDQQRREFNRFWREGGSKNWLTASVLSRFDTNRNGKLEANEAQSLGVRMGQLDVDRNGEVSRDELHAHLVQLQELAGDVSLGLPPWFYELDTNRDQQVAMSEYTTEWTDSKRREFARLDLNGDGLITVAEASQAKSVTGGTYRNENAEVLPPGKTVITEIEVTEDHVVGDLNVELSITHTYVANLDAYLTGPNGQRVELFTEIGGSGDHFDKTVFDDQSRTPITKARAPFKGSFLTEGVTKRQPGLSAFNGKSSKGVWQLVIRGSRSERFGMLHDWALIIKPKEAAPGSTFATADKPEDSDGDKDRGDESRRDDRGERGDSKRSDDKEAARQAKERWLRERAEKEKMVREKFGKEKSSFKEKFGREKTIGDKVGKEKLSKEEKSERKERRKEDRRDENRRDDERRR